jgi:hypothetical protein
MLRGSLCAVVFAVCLYTAQSDPLQPKEDAEQKWSRVSHTYRTLNRVSYYKVYEEPRTWFEASDTCARDGSHLVIINSPDEAAEVKRYLDSTVDTYIIGFHDLFQEGHFQTLQCKYLNFPFSVYSSGNELLYIGMAGAHNVNSGKETS